MVQRPEQMLWAAPPWSELVLNGKLPEEDLPDPHARSEEFAEEPSLRQPRPDATRRPVLDVPGAF